MSGLLCGRKGGEGTGRETLMRNSDLSTSHQGRSCLAHSFSMLISAHSAMMMAPHRNRRWLGALGASALVALLVFVFMYGGRITEQPRNSGQHHGRNAQPLRTAINAQPETQPHQQPLRASMNQVAAAQPLAASSTTAGQLAATTVTAQKADAGQDILLAPTYEVSNTFSAGCACAVLSMMCGLASCHVQLCMPNLACSSSAVQRLFGRSRRTQRVCYSSHMAAITVRWTSRELIS